MEPGAVGHSLSRRPLPDVIAERITTAIANGSLAIGDRLPSEPELARMLGVGRSSLREALRKLHTLGAIEIVRGKGTYIRRPPPDDPALGFVRWSTERGVAAEELLEVRMGLEATAAGLACVRATEQDLQVLWKRCWGDEAAHDALDRDELVRQDELLHQALIDASHNAVLAQLYASLVPSLVEFREKTFALSGAPQRAADDHRAIAVAVHHRDVHEARRAVVRHIWTLYEEVRMARSPGTSLEQSRNWDVSIFL